MVAGQIDLSTGGEGGKTTPMRKLIPSVTGICRRCGCFTRANPKQEQSDEKEKQANKGRGRGATV